MDRPRHLYQIAKGYPDLSKWVGFRYHQCSLSNKRRYAAEFIATGIHPDDLVRLFKISRTTAGRWIETWNALHTLDKPRPRGKRPLLSGEQRDQLAAMLREPPFAFGIGGKRWTFKSISQLIHQKYSITIHPSTVKRSLKGISWDLKIEKPRRPAHYGAYRYSKAHKKGRLKAMKKVKGEATAGTLPADGTP